jgi:hypothetical protein
VRFFCIRASFSVNCEAAAMGLSLTRATRCGLRELIRLNAGLGRDARMRM